MHVAPKAKQLDSYTSFPLNVIACCTTFPMLVSVSLVAHLLWPLTTHQCPTFAYISNTHKKNPGCMGLANKIHAGFKKQKPCSIRLKLFLEYLLTFRCARSCPLSCQRTKLSGSQTINTLLMPTAELPKDHTVWK